MKDISKQTNQYYIQLFIDTGSGFDESGSIKIFIPDEQNNHDVVFDLSPYKKIKSIRLDPINISSVIEIESIALFNEEKSIEIHHEVIPSIGFKKNNRYYFFNNDPQLILKGFDKKELNDLNQLGIKFGVIKLGQDVSSEYGKIIKKEKQSLSKSVNKSLLGRAFNKLTSMKVLLLLKRIRTDSDTLKKCKSCYQTEGLAGILYRLKLIMNPELRMQGYEKYSYKIPVLSNKITLNLSLFKYKPLISIVMPVYNIAPKWLEKAIKSVENQWYKNWELCIVDDASTKSETIEFLKNINNEKIKIIFSDINENIAKTTNKAINLSCGEYIAFLDHDDELTCDALYETLKVLNSEKADFIYSDEDFISLDEKYVNPHFKSDFSPDLLLSHNYITHFVVVKTSLVEQVGDLNAEYDGAQDHDFVLRLTEKAKMISHISKVLYHWRMIETSTSHNSDAKPEALDNAKKVIEYALKRRNIIADVFDANLPFYFRVKRKLIKEPLVSIVIPFKDKPKLLKTCLDSILHKSTYKNFEIIGVSNNSREKTTFDLMAYYEQLDSRIKFIKYDIPYSFSKINNYAFKNYANGEHYILLNNDIEIISPDWIESLLEFSQREDVGVVGAKLYYPNDTIQHAGVIMGIGGYAAHSHRGLNRYDYGYFNRLNIIQNISALTAACFMVKRQLYKAMNGLDEVNFNIAYNDVDFCLRLRESGYLNIFTPYCEAYHHESVSRGSDESGENKKRFDKEKQLLKEIHGDVLEQGDPYYNVNLTKDAENFGLSE